MIRKLAPEHLRSEYQEQLKRNFITTVSSDATTRGYCIPHNAVMKDSVTTPIREVHDCSLRNQGRSQLVDCLKSGPRLPRRFDTYCNPHCRFGLSKDTSYEMRHFDISNPAHYMTVLQHHFCHRWDMTISLLTANKIIRIKVQVI